MTLKTETIIGFGDDYIMMHDDKLQALLDEGVKIIDKQTQVFQTPWGTPRMISNVIYE